MLRHETPQHLTYSAIAALIAFFGPLSVLHSRVGGLMRFVPVVLAAVFLSACGPRSFSTVDVSPRPEAELAAGDGAVLVEVIHAIGSNGPQLDRWTSVKVVSMIEPEKGQKPTLYTLDPVLSLNSDSAIFAGVLPSGFYRLATFEGEWLADRYQRPYGVVLPEKPTEFFVAAGKLNSLGAMLQTSIGDWTWVYQREPGYDMPALVRSLRPELKALDLPLLLSQELVEKKQEPASRIDRAWPTTAVVTSVEGMAMRGAQFGRVYVRHASGTSVEWKSLALDTHQTVTTIVPVAIGQVYALDASGRLFRFNPRTLESEMVEVNVPPRAVSAGFSAGTFFVVSEQPQRDGSVRLQLHKQAGEEWLAVGDPVSALHSPHAVVFTETHVLFTEGGAPYGSRKKTLTSVSLADGTRSVVDTPVQLLRKLGDGRLVGALLPARAPDAFYVSRDGGKKWMPLAGVNVVGWPVTDAEQQIVVPTYRTVNGVQSLYIGPWESPEPGARFPARCLHFMEPAFVDGQLIVFCGERVFQYENAAYGWRKEALHEFQSSLP